MDVTIERILPGGLGLAHAEGKTVMVALAAPGDRLRVRVDREKGTVCFASIVEILEPSPHRLEPPCPYFGRCGGCDFQQMTYQAQLDAKIDIIKDCLHRIAKIENPPEFQITAAPHEWDYRTRAQWQYDSERKRLGYFESGSRRVCDVAACAVLVPELQFVLEDLRALMAKDELGNEVQYFRAIAGDDSALVAGGSSRAHPRIKSRDQFARNPESSRDEMEVTTRTIAGASYRLSAESFFQTNMELLPQLIETAIGAERGETAIELYAGIGLFTLPLARRFRRVVAVEENFEATRFARENLANASLTNTEVQTADVASWLELGRGGRAQRRRRFGSEPYPLEAAAAGDEIQSAVGAGALQIDFLLLDPPRTGAESRVINGILQLRPKRICYVSCDPATLARDLRKIIADGYSLDSLAAFDMFPQTHHVETIAHLTGP